MSRSDSKVPTRRVKDARLQALIDEAARAGETDSYTGKRGVLRTAWQAPATVCITSGSSAGETIYVQARNLCPTGVGIFARKLIPEHTPIQIGFGEEDPTIAGLIKHVTRTVNGFIMGVAFVDP